MEQKMRYETAREILAEALDELHEGGVKASLEDWLTDLPKPAISELKAKHGKELAHTGGSGYRDIGTKKTAELHRSIVGILKKHNVPKLLGSHHQGSSAIQMSFHTFHGDMNEAILKGASARRSILLNKKKEEKRRSDMDSWRTNAGLSPVSPGRTFEVDPTVRLRTRKTDARGQMVGGKKDFSAAQKAAAAGTKDAEEIMDVLHRKPEGTKVKVFGKGPRGTDKSVNLHRKTELGKHRYFHSTTGKEVELVKGGVGLRVLDARTKKVVLDRGNDAIWESVVTESHNIKTLKTMPASRLRKLHAEYKGKGTKEASREASVIKKILGTRKSGVIKEDIISAVHNLPR